MLHLPAFTNGGHRTQVAKRLQATAVNYANKLP